MKKGVIIGIIIIMLAIVGLIYSFWNKEIMGAETERESESTNVIAPSMEKEESEMSDGEINNDLVSYTVAITSSGFSPRTLEINQGDEVVFMNRDTNLHWPATDIHPSHRLYPGSDVNKCKTAAKSEIFDACRGLGIGESYSFRFTYSGTWSYHDHLRPGFSGVIVVK